MKKILYVSFFVILLILSYIFLFSKKQNVIKTTPLSQKTSTTTQVTSSFIVFGDSGTGTIQQKNLARVMLNYPFEFMLHTGDVAYPDGTDQQLKDFFFEIYKDHLLKGPMYPSPGNHDYTTDDLGPYLNLFDLPKQALNEKDSERYYSFDIENIHFIALDTNSPLFSISDESSDDMLDWLTNDLKKSNNSVWKIVYFHHPPYSSGKQHGGSSMVRKLIVPTLEKYNVDIVFSGHEHNYERTCPITNDECSEDGITYVVTGGGGAGLYDFNNKEFFTEVRSSKHNFVQVQVSGCELSLKAIDIENKVIDHFFLNKCQ